MSIDDAVLRHRAQAAPDLDGSSRWDLNVVNGPAELSVVEPASVIGLGNRLDESAREVRTAVLLPCHNEALTIAGVVGDFQLALPGADIYVYDNASTDGT